LCASVGINPNTGVALFLGESGEVVGSIAVSTFVSWVDSSPEPFDYISQSPCHRLLGGAMQRVGVESIKYYHRNLIADPISTIVATQGGWADRNILSIGTVQATELMDSQIRSYI